MFGTSCYLYWSSTSNFFSTIAPLCNMRPQNKNITKRWTIKKVTAEGRGEGGGGRGGGGGRFRAEAKKKKFPRKILIENIYLPTYSGQKNMCPSWKIHIYTFPSFIYKYTQKKNLASLKIPTPLPHHFSNGPSLTFTFFASVIHSNGPLRKHSLSLAGSLAGDICRCNWLISSMFFISFHGKYD